MSSHSIRRRGCPAHLLVAVLLIGTAAGCEVTNPGPVSDEFMTLPTSQQGFVNGAQERLTRALGNEAYESALMAREIFPSGQTGSYGFGIAQQAGSVNWNYAGEYDNGQQARWVAEEAIRKFEERGDVLPEIMVQAYIWAGYANRLLGDFWCTAVIDSGPEQPGSVYWERAEEHFTKAIAIAPTEATRLAAVAGRAQVRLSRENFAGAAADAALVPDAFVWWLLMDFAKGGDSAQRNHVVYAQSDNPYRAWTVNFTYYHQYYADTGDPRTPWRDFPRQEASVCSAALQGFGPVPCTQQMKYLTENDDMRLASGKEMRLIEAEALLVGGDWAGAMAKINALRTSYTSNTTRVALLPWTATNDVEAWTVLKRERGIELWLEARRLPDQRRWEPVIGQPQRPGDLELPDFEARSSIFTTYPRGREITEGSITPRTLCYNISDTEANENDNIPDR